MIERYTLPEMQRLWSQETKYALWLKVELAVLQVQEQLGYVPQGITESVRQKAGFNIDRIEEIEAEVKHDVIAFLTSVNEYVGENGRYIHLGMTSSDLVDTALAMQLCQAGGMIFDRLGTLTQTVREVAFKHKHTPTIGRSHGIHAEPTTFGLKLLIWLDELERHQGRLKESIEALKVGQISGPVGTYSAIDPEVERLTCEMLGLKPARVSNQIIQRDVHADFMNDLALLASTMEKFAIEIRHLQRTEVMEAEEPFTKGQKGSSAMPHKRNPVGSENITGLARMVRAYAMPMMENIALWHERDISHSSVERIVLPDATTLMDYMLHRFNGILEGLQVYPENMAKNMQIKGGIVFSQQVLIALVQQGLTREAAYVLVQRNALAAWNQANGHFKQNLLADPEVTQHLTPEILEACFDVSRSLKHVDAIFQRFETSKVTSAPEKICTG
jgi:adenylosuccinate lyase